MGTRPFRPVAGPSRIPYNPSKEPSSPGPSDNLVKRRTPCSCCRRVVAALVLTAINFPTAEATDAPLHPRNRRNWPTLADHYVEQDGVWVETPDWQLMGRSAQQQVGNSGAQPLNDFAAVPSSSADDVSASAAPSATSSSATASSTQTVNVPNDWTPDPRTSFYAVPIIVVMSVLLAIIIVIIIIVIVVVRKRRRRHGKELRDDDPELVETEKAVQPSTRRGRMSAAVRERTAGLRRRGKKRKMALTRRVGVDGDAQSPTLREEDCTEAVVSPSRAPSLMRQVSQETRSIASFSTRQGGNEDDDDSVTALTATASNLADVEREPGGPTATFFQQPVQHRRSAVSVISVELPSAPPAYPMGQWQPQAGPSSCRSDQKRRWTQQEREEIEDEMPPAVDSEEALPPVDTEGFVGHVATDDKAALARLRDLGSAPEISNTPNEFSAPDAAELEQAMIDKVMEEATDNQRQTMSLLPAPPPRVRPTYASIRASQPSAPPVALATAPSAPPLPEYEPSAPAYEGDDPDGRREHIEV